ncbi:MAG TPA: hypothetical protein PLY93_06285 [Turneriella sp.]|nr:hypothetical protein [Turneriella sp.]
MKSQFISEFTAAFAAEIRKLTKLKTHIAFLAITLPLMLIIMGIEVAMSHNAPGGSAQVITPVNADVTWKIFHFFSQYLTPLIAALVVASQVGKEFEWKTFHQIQLKGQTPLVYVTSKLTALYTMVTGVYVVQVVVVFLFYIVRALIENQSIDIPVGQLATDTLFYFTALPIALMLAVLTASASIGIVLSLVHLLVLEMIFFPLVWQLMSALGHPNVSTVLSYSPMKLPVQIVEHSEGFLETFALVSAELTFIALMGYLAYIVLNRRQIGLIR